MGADRKAKLKKKEKKAFEAEVRKYASLDRAAAALGVKEVLDRLPGRVMDIFVRYLRPGMEVVAADDARDDPGVRDAVRALQALVKEPLTATVDGREVWLAYD